MGLLPRVTELTREAVSREFDDLGPARCVADIVADLERSNPEVLDMMRSCARDTVDSQGSLAGLCMFYRLLSFQSAHEHGRVDDAPKADETSVLPRVTADCRGRIAKEIDERGAQSFTLGYVEQLAQENPELLQMTYAFAAEREDYLLLVQGLALLWASLVAQARVDRASAH